MSACRDLQSQSWYGTTWVYMLTQGSLLNGKGKAEAKDHGAAQQGVYLPSYTMQIRSSWELVSCCAAREIMRPACEDVALGFSTAITLCLGFFFFVATAFCRISESERGCFFCFFEFIMGWLDSVKLISRRDHVALSRLRSPILQSSLRFCRLSSAIVFATAYFP